MATKLEIEYPVHLLAYLAQLSQDSAIASVIVSDEYVFSTYLAALLQGFSLENDSEVLSKVLNTYIPKINLKDIDPTQIDAKKQDEMIKVVDSLRAQFNEQITTTYVRDFLVATAIYREMISRNRDHDIIATLQGIVSGVMGYYSSSKGNRRSSITINLDRLANVMQLTNPEVRLMEMAFLFSTDVRSIIFRNFAFTMMKNASMYDHSYRVMLGQTSNKKEVSEINDALSTNSKPIVLGIVSYDMKLKRLSKMSDYWVMMIATYVPTDIKYFERFVSPIKERKKTFSGAIAKVGSEKDTQIFEEFLQKVTVKRTVPDMLVKLERDDITHTEKPVDESLGRNVLIYGSRSLDKLGYVAIQLEKLKINGFQVRVKDARAPDIPSICYVAQQWIDQTEDGAVVLIVDRAEQALTREYTRPVWMMDFFDDSLDRPEKKEELDSDELLMINNPIPTIWLTNSAQQITPENVGRFLFHLQLKGGSRKDRRDEIEKVVKELGFSDDIVQKLSMYLELNVEQIKSAARMIKLLGKGIPSKEAREQAEKDGAKLDDETVKKIVESEEVLLHLVENSQRALDREKTEKLRESVTKYSLDLLNIQGNMSIEKIIKALKRKPHGTMVFWGLPGTGKTALAEYIAMQLDMPMLLKPASELLNMYLGETEKEIAKAFEEAKQMGAIFLLDEADSFLRDRSMAQRSWEVTQVNELLQRMERFNGIFICATNLFSQLDAAALRRFTFKLEFRELTEKQRMMMLANECNLDFSNMDKDLKEKIEFDLLTIPCLTPGDFATIKRQIYILGEELTVDDWIARLRVEADAKLVGVSRNSYRTNRQQVPEVTPRHKND